MERLTDEVSDIADRLTVAAKSWARQDALEHRDPTSELSLLLETMNELNARRLRIAALEAALRPFGAAVYNDNVDVTISYGHIDVGDWMRARRVLKET